MAITILNTKELPIKNSYSNYIVGHPTLIENYGVMTDYLNYYLTQNVSHFIDETIPYLAASDKIPTGSLIFQYKKSSGVTTLRFEFEPHLNIGTDFESAKSFYAVLSMPSGAKFIDPQTGRIFHSQSTTDRPRKIFLTPTGSSTRPTYFEYVDVSSLNSSSLYAFTASFYSLDAATSSSVALGFGTFRGYEIPRKVIVPNSSNSIGYDTPVVGEQPIVELGSVNPYGIKTLVREIERLKNEIPNQINLSFLSDSFDSCCLRKTYATTSGSFLYGTNTISPTAGDKHFFLRTNNTYGTGSNQVLSSSYLLSIVYGTSGVGKYNFYLKYRASGSTDWSEKNLSLVNSTTPKYVIDQQVLFPTTGSYGIVECFVDAKAFDDINANLKVYNIHLRENNS